MSSCNGRKEENPQCFSKMACKFNSWMFDCFYDIKYKNFYDIKPYQTGCLHIKPNGKK